MEYTVICEYPNTQVLMDFVITTLSENQYFSAGFGLFGVGALAAAGKRLTAAGLVLFRRHCITSLGMDSL